ncbi:hypothetical protein LTR56_014224 [Elasticomyces elasticus]|nr:hypothetical protein LTR56_014224 [Elasticomyces elasticus]KAK3645279.1 hypothetical protein LTR22_014857 [Elasticomyces elasticus]KAK4917389.1 hypothetical protein LTR49_014743 [Elasticomyces elasticus]KAK5755123.1 hypothetical protein LTS12_014806 [Elasticomyces elasticus]
MRATAGHAAHGMDMTTGLPEDYESFRDWMRLQCNVDWEPWVWDCMRGEHDHYFDTIDTQLASIPDNNPPFWSPLPPSGSPPALPDTVWGGSADVVSSRSKKSRKSKGKPTNSKSKASKEVQGQAPGPVGRPQHGNLSNTGNICFASSVIQAFCNVPALKKMVVESDAFPFRLETGRGALAGMYNIGDPNFVRHRNLLRQLRDINALLENAQGQQLGTRYTLDFMRTLRSIDHADCRQFTTGAEHDSSRLLDTLLGIFNNAGDSSQPLTDTLRERPNWKYEKAIEAQMKSEAGGLVASLQDDVPEQLRLYRVIGNTSPISDLCTYQLVQEARCEHTGCLYPVSRSMTLGRMLTCDFPYSDTGPARAYTVPELIEIAITPPARGTCERDASHGLRELGQPRLVRAGEVFILRIERMTAASMSQYDEAHAGFNASPLVLEPMLDLRPFFDRHLPSEDYHDKYSTARIDTMYELVSVMQYVEHGRHYVNLSKTPDQNGNMHWALFDDLRSLPVWRDPLSNQGDGRTSDVVLIYTRMTPEAVKAAAAARNQTSDADDDQSGAESESDDGNVVGDSDSDSDSDDDLSDYEVSVGGDLDELRRELEDLEEDIAIGEELLEDSNAEKSMNGDVYDGMTPEQKGSALAGYWREIAPYLASKFAKEYAKDGGEELTDRMEICAARSARLGRDYQALLDRQGMHSSSTGEKLQSGSPSLHASLPAMSTSALTDLINQAVAQLSLRAQQPAQVPPSKTQAAAHTVVEGPLQHRTTRAAALQASAYTAFGQPSKSPAKFAFGVAPPISTAPLNANAAGTAQAEQASSLSTDAAQQPRPPASSTPATGSGSVSVSDAFAWESTLSGKNPFAQPTSTAGQAPAKSGNITTTADTSRGGMLPPSLPKIKEPTGEATKASSASAPATSAPAPTTSALAPASSLTPAQLGEGPTLPADQRVQPPGAGRRRRHDETITPSVSPTPATGSLVSSGAPASSLYSSRAPDSSLTKKRRGDSGGAIIGDPPPVYGGASRDPRLGAGGRGTTMSSLTTPRPPASRQAATGSTPASAIPHRAPGSAPPGRPPGDRFQLSQTSRGSPNTTTTPPVREPAPIPRDQGGFRRPSNPSAPRPPGAAAASERPALQQPSAGGIFSQLSASISPTTATVARLPSASRPQSGAPQPSSRPESGAPSTGQSRPSYLNPTAASTAHGLGRTQSIRARGTGATRGQRGGERGRGGSGRGNANQ